MASTLGTKQLVVYAIKSNGDAPFIAPALDLTWTSSDGSKATVSSSGLVTGIATGSALISTEITANTDINATAECTVPA